MPIRNGTYNKRTTEEQFTTVANELLKQNDDANPRAESTYTYALLWAVVSTLSQNQEETLENVYQSAYVADATNEELTKKAHNLGVIRQDAQKATGVVAFTRGSPATTDYTIPSGTIVETLDENPIQYETTTPVIIDGPEETTDGSIYTTSSTSYVAKTSQTIETAYRDSLDVQADIKTGDSSYTANVEIVDATNNTTIANGSTTSTTYTTIGPQSYDISALTDDITVEYRIKTSDSNGTASLTNSSVDLPGQTGARATVIAVEGGSGGNVGPNAIQSMPSPPTGVSEVTNPQPTGDPSILDTNGDPLRVGRDRESDSELRQRVLNTDATSEGPSADGIELALSETTGVISSHINSNQTASTVNGLDPYHTEVVVYGGDVYDIGRTLYETMSATALLRLQGGVHGSKESTSVYSQLLDKDITIPITRPSFLTFTLTADVVHTSSYAGDIAVKDAVVRYIGGTYADDSTITGLGVGDNVLINEIENRVEDVQGVEYANITLIDTNGDGVDDTTTDSDGVPILEVSDSEVSRVDADSITVNTTAR